MAIELKLLGVAVIIGLVQLLWAAAAARGQQDLKWAAGPRDTPMPISGSAARLHRAFWNFVDRGCPAKRNERLALSVANDASWRSNGGKIS